MEKNLKKETKILEKIKKKERIEGIDSNLIYFGKFMKIGEIRKYQIQKIRLILLKKLIILN
jgi:hypothetical protein